MTHRTFISIILAAAIAVTGMSAAPARADNDAAKVIAGVAALAIIGAAIAEERKDRRRKAARNRAYNDAYDYDYRHDNGRFGRPNRFKAHALPGRCLRRVDTRHGPVRGFGRRCLLNNYSNFNALPHNCAVRTRGYDGQRRVIYRSHCLKQYGYVAYKDRR